jgi:hypothetical protein
MIAIDPEEGVRPSRIIAFSYRSHLPVRFKETCFGLLAEGEREVVRGLLGRLKEEHGSGLFFKRRGYSIGDTRVCADTFARTGMRRAAGQLKFHNHS